jgi:release factor glutamine methyltransferase
VSTAALVERLRAAGCVFAEREAALLLAATDDATELEAMVRRRVAGQPLEVVLGWAEFAGLRVVVDPGVFVPRPRSEALVAEAVTRGRAGATIVDLCCGTGAVGLAVATALDGHLHSVDLDPGAVACARRNVPRVYQGDLYEPLPAGLRAELVLLVAPYVPTAEIDLLPREARLHEPRGALDGGPDGLDVVRRAIEGAPGRLAAGGWIVIEVSDRQAEATAEAMRGVGLAASVVRDERLDTTVVLGQYR